MQRRLLGVTQESHESTNGLETQTQHLEKGKCGECVEPDLALLTHMGKVMQAKGKQTDLFLSWLTTSLEDSLVLGLAETISGRFCGCLFCARLSLTRRLWCTSLVRHFTRFLTGTYKCCLLWVILKGRFKL